MAGRLGNQTSSLGRHPRYRGMPAIPDRLAPWSHRPPVRVPGGLLPLGAPTAAVGEAEAVRHLEDGGGRGGACVPTPTRVELLAIHRHGIRSREKASGVKGVDRHVEQQGAGYLVAEAAEVRANIEVAVEDAEWANLLSDQSAKRGKLRMIATALRDHIQFPRLFRGRYHGPR